VIALPVIVVVTAALVWALDGPFDTEEVGAQGEAVLVASDTGKARNAARFWGRVECTRHEPPLTPAHQVLRRSGDPHRTAVGSRQGNRTFRRLTVYDGDDVSGERCELGLNDHFSGPTAFYREGERYLTAVSIRLPRAFSVNSPYWRVVLQMKQAQPYNNLEGGSMLELQVRDGRWLVISDWRNLWSAPARSGKWVRFFFDITYSRDPTRGAVQVSADLKDDTGIDAISPLFRVDTLRTESLGGVASGILPGDSIPSHLRVGIYQDAIYQCRRSGAGCSVDIDNVQVIKR
jgi:Polysaccharide lyase